ncbi:MAG: hypothetical protein AB7U73_25710 [Pirellulales bacterium]
MTSCLLVLLLAGTPSQYGDGTTTTEVVGSSMSDGDYDSGCESCSSCDSGGCSSCGGCGRGRCGGCCDDYGWIRRAGPMPQTCYNPRFGCYSGNNRFMHRYPAFHGYYYRNPYNYRNLFDYPWHAELHEPTSLFSYNFEEDSAADASTPTDADASGSPTARALPGRGGNTRRIAGYTANNTRAGVQQASARGAAHSRSQGVASTPGAAATRGGQANSAVSANRRSPTSAAGATATAAEPERRSSRWFSGGLFRRGGDQ